MTPIVWALVFAVPAYWVQTLAHELAHAAVLRLQGYRPVISLLPRRLGGRLLFAQTTVADIVRFPLPAVIAPRVLNLAQVTALRLHPAAPWAHGLVLVALVAAAVDFTWNTLAIFWDPHPSDAWDAVYAAEGPAPSGVVAWRGASAAAIAIVWAATSTAVLF